MVLVWQGAQRLGQQPRLLHINIEVALSRLMQRATGADKVAQIPGLDRRQRFLIESLTIQIELYGLGAVLYQQKSTPIANQPARDRKLPVALFQLRLVTVAKLTLQFRRFCSAAKIIWKRIS